MWVYIQFFRKLRKIHFPFFFSLMPDSDMLFSMVKKEGWRNDVKCFFNVDTHKNKLLFTILRPTSLHCHLHSNLRNHFLSKNPWNFPQSNLLLAFTLSFCSRFSSSLLAWTLLNVLAYHLSLSVPASAALATGLSSPPYLSCFYAFGKFILPAII